MKNKKANLPIVILVLGVLAVCGVILLNFTLFKKNYDEDFNCLSVIETVNSIAEKVKFYESINKDPILEISDLNGKYSNTNFKIDKKGETYFIDAKYTGEGSCNIIQYLD